MKRINTRTLIHGALLAAALAAAPAALSAPRPAFAAADQADGTTAVNADSSKEIVYIDGNGFIRVFDPQYQAGKQVDWVSPEGDFRNAALGDFNNDGDMEIVGVKGSTASDSVFVVYDPVIASGTIIPGQTTPNGIPWRELYRGHLPSRPETVAAGNFDPNVPGDEIAIVRATVPADAGSSNDVSTLVIYKQTSQTPDGTSWTQHTLKTFSQNWQRVKVGNWDRSGGDEVVLVDPNAGDVRAYQPDNNMALLGKYGSNSKPAKDATWAQWNGSGNQEVIITRDPGDTGDKAILVCKASTAGGDFNCDTPSTYGVGPRVIAAGNILGAGSSQQVFMLRSKTGSTPPLLLGYAESSSGIMSDWLNGLGLSESDDFRAIAMGDIDGDGKDEIVIAGPNKMRWYTDPNNSTVSTDFSTTTNKQTLLLGNLDTNGYLSGPQFGANIQSINAQVNVGFTTNGLFLLKNVTSNETIPFNTTLDGNPTWFSINPSGGTAPGVSSGGLAINYTIDGTKLYSGTFSTTIRFSSTDSRVQAFAIPVTVNAVVPPFQAIPPGATAFYYPCQDPLNPQQLVFKLQGKPGESFDALARPANSLAAAAAIPGNFYLGRPLDNGKMELVGPAGTGAVVDLTAPAAVTDTNVFSFPSTVPWISSITAVTTTLPATLTLTIDPSQRTENMDQASLVLFGPSFTPGTPEEVRSYSIELTCVDWASWLPRVSK